MAERRMFAKTIVDSDAFLDMPVTARLLYYDLAMRADDDGFNNAPRKVMRTIGASPDDLNVLVARKFVIPFDNGVVVIKHWRIHNYIRKDTYRATAYKDQFEMLEFDENNVYRLKGANVENVNEPSTECQLLVDEPLTQDRLGKDRKIIEADKPPTRKRFVPPTVQDVAEYCRGKGYAVNAERFVDYYTANGWKVGKNPMRDWRAAVRTWVSKEKLTVAPATSGNCGYVLATQEDPWDELMKNPEQRKAAGYSV